MLMIVKTRKGKRTTTAVVLEADPPVISRLWVAPRHQERDTAFMEQLQAASIQSQRKPRCSYARLSARPRTKAPTSQSAADAASTSSLVRFMRTLMGRLGRIGVSGARANLSRS